MSFHQAIPLFYSVDFCIFAIVPSNKEAFIRYRVIDQIIRNPHRPYPSIDRIIDVLEDKLGKSFSKSTIQKDIKAMKEDEALGFLAPLAWSKSHNGYYYRDPQYTLASVPLNEDDLEAIEFATTVLEQFSDVPIFRQYTDAVKKIMEAADIRDALAGVDDMPYIQFEQRPTLSGSEWLSRLVVAIKNRQQIRMGYQPFNSTEINYRDVSPYLLREYRDRWYLIGMEKEGEKVKTFGLDRIRAVEVTEETFIPHYKFNPEDYFKYAFGITAYDGEPIELILSFTPAQQPYLTSQPLHHTQEVLVDSNEEFRIRLKVFPTIEVKMHLLSYGPEVKILFPTWFRDEIAADLSKAAAHY